MFPPCGWWKRLKSNVFHDLDMNQDGDGGSDNGGRDIFATNSDIFENRDLLKVGYVPGLDQIVGREEQIQSVGQSIGSATVGDSPDTLLIYGKTGCGKSLVARAVTREAKQKSCRERLQLRILIYRLLRVSNGRLKRVGKSLARSRGRSVTPILISPGRGYRLRIIGIWFGEMMFDYDIDSFVVILDEIDMLKDENLIRSLSRAEESGKTDGYVSLIGISNKLNYREQLDPRTDSSFRGSKRSYSIRTMRIAYEIFSVQQRRSLRRRSSRERHSEDSCTGWARSWRCSKSSRYAI